MAHALTGRKDSTKGYVVAVTSAIILSSTAIFIGYLTRTYAIPALIIAFWRALFVTLTLVAALGLVQPSLLCIQARHLGYLGCYGFVLAVFNALWTLSVVLNGAAVSTVLVYSSAGFTVLLGRWLLDESLGWAKCIAVILSMAGCGLVSDALTAAVWQTNLMGILTGVLSGLGYAFYTLMGRAASQRGLKPWTTLLYTFGFATLFLLGFNLCSFGILPGAAMQPADLFWLGNAVAGWGILILLAAGPTVAGFGLYNVSLVYLPSGVVNLIATLEPAFTAIIAYLLLGERLTGMQLAGSLLIMFGVISLSVGEGCMDMRTKAGMPTGNSRGMSVGPTKLTIINGSPSSVRQKPSYPPLSISPTLR